MVTDVRDPFVALRSVRSYLDKTYKIGTDKTKNRAQLEANGYVFKDDIWKHTQSGDAAVLSEMLKNSLNEVAYSVAIDTHRHGRAFHHEVGEIGAACGLPYEDTRSIVF